jgi:hypothetical protein
MIKWPTQQTIRRMASAMMSSSMLLRSADSKEMTNSNKGDSKKQQQQQQQRSRRPRSRQSSRPRATTVTAPPLEPPNRSYLFPDYKGQSSLRPSNSNISMLKTMDKWMDDHYPEEPLPSNETSGSNRLVRTEMSHPQQQQRQPSNESSRSNMLVRKEMRSSEPRSKRKTRKITLEPEEHQQQEVQPPRPFLQQKASQPQQQQQQLPITAPTINLIRDVINDDDDDNAVASDMESVYTMERTIEDGDGDTVTLATAATMESSFTLMEMKRSTCKMLHDEILGVMDDACRSVEQVFTAFTLQEADVKAVCTRIDRAKVQMTRSLKITTVHEERRRRVARRLEL